MVLSPSMFSKIFNSQFSRSTTSTLAFPNPLPHLRSHHTTTTTNALNPIVFQNENGSHLKKRRRPAHISFFQQLSYNPTLHLRYKISITIQAISAAFLGMVWRENLGISSQPMGIETQMRDASTEVSAGKGAFRRPHLRTESCSCSLLPVCSVHSSNLLPATNPAPLPQFQLYHAEDYTSLTSQPSFAHRKCLLYGENKWG
jgi:hypothetical protein